MRCERCNKSSSLDPYPPDSTLCDACFLVWLAEFLAALKEAFEEYQAGNVLTAELLGLTSTEIVEIE
jgi:hypothetical protein